MMLGEESESADYWKKCGDEALANNIKGVIFMGAHWDCLGNKIQVATKPSPGKQPVAYVNPEKYLNYPINVDVATAHRAIDMLAAEGFEVSANPEWDWIHDAFLILIRMFPEKCPPTTLVSLNARYDPHFHMKIGSTLRPLRLENYLFVGSGGGVHNLYRNIWKPMYLYRDNFAMPTPPGEWALEFRQSLEDALTKNKGPALRRAVTRLMKHPRYREAHATDDHFMSAMFVAGACGDVEDEAEEGGKLTAETWELTNMCNAQFTFGSWSKNKAGMARGGKTVSAAA
ncbi:MAG: hypothetical protein M1834_003710 [Cirrosporium novae-zelandiae]|nr:MAG: hypothetical protein M1834_003710 [Cirrosporium novae-zelandiae]